MVLPEILTICWGPEAAGVLYSKYNQVEMVAKRESIYFRNLVYLIRSKPRHSG